MIIKVLFAVSVILSGLFLALPVQLGGISGAIIYSNITVGQLVGVLAVIFETWWVVKKLRGR